jgi:biopolymer transport protein ExbB
MTKVQLSIKTGEIDEAIVLCDKQQGSVANSIKSAFKYKQLKEGFKQKKLLKLFTKKSKKLLLKCQCCKKT